MRRRRYVTVLLAWVLPAVAVSLGGGAEGPDQDRPVPPEEIRPALAVAPEKPQTVADKPSVADPPVTAGKPPDRADPQASAGDEPAATGVRRDPFWPVGYAPRKPEKKPVIVAGDPGVKAPPPVEVARPPDWEEARKRLEIRGISRLGKPRTGTKETYLAAVNGKIVEEGELVMAAFDGRVYRWRVVGIAPGGLSLQKLDVRAE